MNTCYMCSQTLPKELFAKKKDKITNKCKSCHNAYIRERKKGRLTRYENKLIDNGMVVVYYNKNGVWERRLAKKINDSCVLEVCYFKYKGNILFHAGDWLIKHGKVTLKASDIAFKLFYKLNKPK